MKSKAMFTVVGCVVGSAMVLGQATAPQAPAPAAAQGRGRGGAPQGPVVCQGTTAFAAQHAANAAVAAAARGAAGAPAAGAPGRGARGGGAPAAAPAAAPAPAREVVIAAIPGVIAATAKWTRVWEGPGNNSDGAVALSDGSLLIAQEDNSTVLKIDKDDKTLLYLADTHGAGSLSIDPMGRIWAVQRMPNGVGATAPGAATTAGIAILYPASDKKVINTFSDGTPWNGRPNDLAADGKGGAYFTQGCVYYAAPDGRIKLVAENLRTNGIVLSPDGKILYVTNGAAIAALDVQADGSLTNQREFMTGGMGGDGLAVDAAGNIYDSGGTDIKVVSPKGVPLGLIPTPTGTISVAFGGPLRKNLYIVANGARDAFGTAVAGPNQPAFAAWRTVYKIPMLSTGLKTRGK